MIVQAYRFFDCKLRVCRITKAQTDYKKKKQPNKKRIWTRLYFEGTTEIHEFTLKDQSRVLYIMADAEKSKVAFITGTTSNLGINIAYRLIDQLPQSTNVTLVVTSRTLPRVTDVITEIKNHVIEKYPNRTGSLEFDYVLLDFSDMVSVLSAYYDLNKKYTKVDYLFINSSQGLFSGIDWMGATKEVLSNPLEAVTNPTYKTQKVGVMSTDNMGLVFQANVFGPYYLIHKTKHLLQNGGKIIWISSIMSDQKFLSFNDLQLIKSPESYEGSKRLIDLLHFASYKTLKTEYNIDQYLVHPGIFISYSFSKFLNVFTYYGMLLLFYLARLCGSPYHNISGYIAANAPIVAALGSEDQKFKLGSTSNKYGQESLLRKEIDTTGAEDVLAYLDQLVGEWDVNFKDQIVNTRQP